MGQVRRLIDQVTAVGGNAVVVTVPEARRLLDRLNTAERQVDAARALADALRDSSGWLDQRDANRAARFVQRRLDAAARADQ